MRWIYDDGGREHEGYRGHTNDCVVRAIAIALRLKYKKAESLVIEYVEKYDKKKLPLSEGVYDTAYRPLLEDYGWFWKPMCFVGMKGRKYINDKDVPFDIVICSLQQHLCTVDHHVVRDTRDYSGACVFGIFTKK